MICTTIVWAISQGLGRWKDLDSTCSQLRRIGYGVTEQVGEQFLAELSFQLAIQFPNQ